MKKDISKSIKDVQNRKIFYISGIIFSVILLSIAVIFYIYVSNIDNSRNETFPEAKGLTDASKEISFSEKASSEIGKSIEEVKIEEKNKQENKDVLYVQTESDAKQENISKEPEEIMETEKKRNTENSSQNNDVKETSNAEIEEIKEPVFSMPVEGEIIKEFAKDKLVYSDTLNEWITHTGIDIKAEKTSVVKAAEDGIVKFIKNDPRYGLTVIIEHNMRI